MDRTPRQVTGEASTAPHDISSSNHDIGFVGIAIEHDGANVERAVAVKRTEVVLTDFGEIVLEKVGIRYTRWSVNL